MNSIKICVQDQADNQKHRVRRSGLTRGIKCLMAILINLSVISCGIDGEPKCVPGWRQPTWCFYYMSCSPFYDDCIDPTDADFSSLSTFVYIPGQAFYPPIKVGDIASVRMNFSFPKTSYDRIDSVTWEVCNGILKRMTRFPYPLNTKQDFLWSVVDSAKVVIADHQPFGNYVATTTAWADGAIFKTSYDVFGVYPKEQVNIECANGSKIKLMAYLPLNTPKNSSVQIRQFSKDWPFETDSIYNMNKVNDYVFSICLNFRGGELYYIYRDGKKSKCWSYGDHTTCEYGAYVASEGQLSIEIIRSWADSDSLPNPARACDD